VRVEGASGWSERARAGARRALRVGLLAALALWAGAAEAQKCEFDVVTAMAFTGYSPFGGGVPATATIRYGCQNKVDRAWITIGDPRTMTGPSPLAFQLFRDPARSTPWPSTPPVPAPAAKDNNVVTVYGWLPAPQDAAVGPHTRTLVVSLSADSIGNVTDTIDLVVSADVAPACVISPGALDFGSYDPLSASPKDGQGAITVECTRGPSYTVALGPGNNAAGATRQLASGASRLRYGLYSDAGRTTDWTATSMVTVVPPSTAPVPLVVYGRIAAGQPAAPGDYADVVQATINF
jgi:spore coat protein U-like protein